MSEGMARGIEAVAALIGAIVAVLTFLRVRPPAWASMWASIKKALMAGGLGLGIGVATWFVLSFIGNTVFADDTSPPPSSTHATNTTTSLIPTSSNTVSSTVVSQTVQPIKFRYPKEGQAVGRVVNTYGTGTVPNGKHLWIFEYAPDVKLFYTAGEASVDRSTNYWSRGGVTFGGNVPGDINVPYAIYALVVDSQLSAKIEATFKQDNGEKGTPTLPGRADPAKVPHVTVLRTH